MADFFRLVKIELLSLFGINKVIKSKDKSEKKKLAVFLSIILFSVGGAVFLSIMLNIAFANVFNETGGPQAVRMLASMMYPLTFILLVAMTIHNVNGVLFGFKDYEILMSLPIKTSAVISAKLFFMYILDLASVMTLLIPCYFLYGWFNDSGATYYVVNSLMLFVLPLIPMAVSIMAGTLVTFISSRMQRRSLFEIIITMLFLCLLLSMNFLGEKEIASVGSAFDKGWITTVYTKISCDLNLWYILGFLGVTAVSTAAVYVVLIKFYKPINSALLSRGNKSNFVLKAQKQTSPIKALFVSELKRFFSLPVYVLNTAVSGLIGILMIVISVIKGGVSKTGMYGLITGGVTESGNGVAMLSLMIALLPIFVAGMTSTLTTTASSISIEGKTLWIVKSCPIKNKDLITVKLLLDWVIFVPITAVSEILLAVLFKFPVVDGIIITLTGMVFAVFAGVIGLIINVRHPLYDWETEAKPVKQSIASVYNMIFVWLSALVTGGVTGIVYKFVSYRIALITGLAVTVAAAATAIAVVYKKYTDKLFIEK